MEKTTGSVPKPSLWTRFRVFIRWINPWWQQRRYDEALDCFGEQIRELYRLRVADQAKYNDELSKKQKEIAHLTNTYWSQMWDPAEHQFVIRIGVSMKDAMRHSYCTSLRTELQQQARRQIDDLLAVFITKNLIKRDYTYDRETGTYKDYGVKIYPHEDY